eukprot:gene27241-48785_t
MGVHRAALASAAEIMATSEGAHLQVPDLNLTVSVPARFPGSRDGTLEARLELERQSVDFHREVTRSEGVKGVIDMGLLNVIRKLRLRQGLAIREIERRTGLSRNTIKKYLKADTIEPKFTTPERSSKLDPFAEKLTGWLKTNAKKGRKDRQTLKKMHADLVALGFTGSYNRVAAFARQWKADRQREEQTTGRGTFIPLAFRPGEAFQFDWSEDFAVLGGDGMEPQRAIA